MLKLVEDLEAKAFPEPQDPNTVTVSATASSDTASVTSDDSSTPMIVGDI